MRPRDLCVPGTLGGGGRGVSEVRMSVVGPVSEAPARTALRLSSSEGSVPWGGGSASVTRLGISPAGRAILQPLGGCGGGQQGTLLKRPEPPTPQPSEGSRLHQCLRDLFRRFHQQ